VSLTENANKNDLVAKLSLKDPNCSSSFYQERILKWNFLKLRSQATPVKTSQHRAADHFWLRSEVPAGLQISLSSSGRSHKLLCFLFSNFATVIHGIIMSISQFLVEFAVPYFLKLLSQYEI
jgi:hypothetical protein